MGSKTGCGINMIEYNYIVFLTPCVQHLLAPLCRSIETDLRLHIHLHLQLDDRNPFKVGMRDLSHLLRVRPIRFFERTINVKGELEM